MEECYEERQSYIEHLQRSYMLPGNEELSRLIGEYDLTYNRARRVAMLNDGLTFSEISKLEGVSKSTIQASVDQARNKIAFRNIKYP